MGCEVEERMRKRRGEPHVMKPHHKRSHSNESSAPSPPAHERSRPHRQLSHPRTRPRCFGASSPSRKQLTTQRDVEVEIRRCESSSLTSHAPSSDTEQFPTHTHQTTRVRRQTKTCASDERSANRFIHFGFVQAFLERCFVQLLEECDVGRDEL